MLLDVRWALGDDRGREHYLEAHLPGAVYVDLETELADPPSPAGGRHPLPSLQRLQSSARRWGIRQDDAVVVYDASGGLAAARAWWLLRWGGLTDVRLLDGGLDAWLRAGGPVESGDVVPEPGDVDPDRRRHAGADDRRRGRVARGRRRAPRRPGGGAVPRRGRADRPAGRARARRGERSHDGEPRPGRHLPRRPTTSVDRFDGLGVRPGGTVGVYCGSGVTAAHEVAALAVAGIDAALWPGLVVAVVRRSRAPGRDRPRAVSAGA